MPIWNEELQKWGYLYYEEVSSFQWLGIDRDMTESQDQETPQPQGIGWAIKQMHNGNKVQRAGWNGKNMWLALQIPDAHSKMTLPYIYMYTADKNLVPWLASQTDILATDWSIVRK